MIASILRYSGTIIAGIATAAALELRSWRAFLKRMTGQQQQQQEAAVQACNEEHYVGCSIRMIEVLTLAVRMVAQFGAGWVDLCTMVVCCCVLTGLELPAPVDAVLRSR
jgi:hypothetical protein